MPIIKCFTTLKPVGTNKEFNPDEDVDEYYRNWRPEIKQSR